MWTVLTLAVLTASTPAPPFEVAVGARVRLTAPRRVDVPGVYSGDERTYSSKPFTKRDGLLAFARDDGSSDSVIAPGATVEGTLVGADPVWVHIRRSDKAPAERILLASVARVQVLRGKKRASRKGSLIGLGVGAAAGLGFYTYVSGPPGSDTPRSAGGFLVSAAVPGAAGLAIGALLGLAGTADDWREVPLGALPGTAPRGPATAHLVDTSEAMVEEAPLKFAPLVFVGGAPGPLRRAVTELTTGATPRR